MSKINKIKVENTTYDIQDNTSGFITKDVNDLTNYELKTATGNSIEMSIDSSTYVMTLSLKNSQGTILNTQTVDLPLETMVVGGTYDSTNKKIVLTLKNGNTIDVPVGDLINGLQSEITSTNKLDASLVDDSLSTNKFVTPNDKTNWDSKEDTSNKVTTIDSTSTDTQYASAKAIYDLVSSASGGGGVNVEYLETTAQNGRGNIFVYSTIKKGLYIGSVTNAPGLGYKITGSETTYETITNFGGNLLYLYIEKEYNEVVETTSRVKIGKAWLEHFKGSGDYEGAVVNTNLYFDPTTNKIECDSQGTFPTTKYKYLTDYEQTIRAKKLFDTIPEYAYNSMVPTTDLQLTSKKYVDDKPTTYTGYDSTKTQILKNINGTLTWVDE